MMQNDAKPFARNFTRMLFRQPRKGILLLSRPWNAWKFRIQGAHLGPGARLEGKITLRLAGGAVFEAGARLHVTGGFSANRIGRSQATCISAGENGRISIGEGAGISASCIWAMERIEIGNHVNIGADCILMDHDAHSLDAMDRRDPGRDKAHTVSAPVVIGDDVLLGARCIVLKGVTIGAGSIVGAGSVVTGDIPAGEIWAGNPARFIRRA